MRIPRSASHASNGPGIDPLNLRASSKVLNIAGSCALRDPRMTSLCPAKYFVTEFMVISAPSASGCWLRAVANVLSTATVTPRSFAALISAGRSATSRPGLVGDSIQSKVAPFKSIINSEVFGIETKETLKRLADA